MKKLIIASLLLLTMVSCEKTPDGPSDDPRRIAFLASREQGAYNEKGVILVFNEQMHQKAISGDKLQSRIQNDEQTELLNLELSSRPTTINEVVELKVTSVGVTGVKDGTYKVVLLKSDQAKLWLWDEQNYVGFIVP
ncbi:MAG: hypothetical protein RR286_04650 [Mucinivorans sp.]